MYGLRVLENRVLGRIFGSEDEVAAERGRPRTEKLYYLWAYCSPNTNFLIILSRMRWAGHVASKRTNRSVHRGLV